MKEKRTLRLKSRKTVRMVMAMAIAMLACTEAAAQTVAADSTAATDGTAIPDTLIAKADTLNGVVVTAKEIIRYDDHLLLYPDKDQRQHAANGFDVMKNMMLPGVNVDTRSGRISALGHNIRKRTAGRRNGHTHAETERHRAHRILRRTEREIRKRPTGRELCSQGIYIWRLRYGKRITDNRIQSRQLQRLYHAEPRQDDLLGIRRRRIHRLGRNKDQRH